MADGPARPVVVSVRVPAALRGTTGGRATVEVALSPDPDGGAAVAGDAAGAAGSRDPKDDAAPGAGRPPGGTAHVRALLDHLAATHPDLERRVRDEQGVLRRHVNVFRGATNIRDLDEQDTALADGDEVAILPAVSGG